MLSFGDPQAPEPSPDLEDHLRSSPGLLSGPSVLETCFNVLHLAEAAFASSLVAFEAMSQTRPVCRTGAHSARSWLHWLSKRHVMHGWPHGNVAPQLRIMERNNLVQA